MVELPDIVVKRDVKRIDAMMAVAMAAIVFIVFSPALSNGFVRWADDFNLLDNPTFRGFSPDKLRWMFTTFYWGHYQPLAWLSYAIDFHRYGLDPVGFHLTNILLHALNTVLFYFLAKSLVGRFSDRSTRLSVGCGFGAMVFALHPLRVESVAWASTRGDLLCATFSLLTVISYVKFRDAQNHGGWYLWSLCVYALSLLSRSWSMTLPAVLLILDIYPLRAKRFLLNKIPFAALAALAVVASLLARKTGMGLTSLSEHGIAARVAQAAYGLCFYLWKTFVPMNLSPLYLLNHTVRVTNPKYLLCVFVIVGLSAALFAARRRRPWAWAAWLGYVMTVSPVLGFSQSGWQIAADRYTYLPLMPIGMLIAAGLARTERRSMTSLLGIMLILLAGLSGRQILVWHDTLTLWTHARAQDPSNYVAINLMGQEKERAGNLAGARQDYDEALRLDPRYIGAYINRANLRFRQGDLEKAEADYDEVIRLNPLTENAFAVRGALRQQRGNASGALEDYGLALSLNPFAANILKNRAVLLYGQGRRLEAITDYNTLLKITPNSAEAHLNRGRLKQEAGDLEGALADFDITIRIAPDSADAFVDRAVVKSRLGDAGGALADCCEAIHRNPTAPLAYLNRGFLFGKRGEREKALNDFQRSLDLAPRDWPYRAQIEAAISTLRLAREANETQMNQLEE
jgi:protein O-mannosyl-transferase